MSVADGDDDEAFLLALDAAEAAALDSSKRRRLSTTSSSSTPSTPPATPEGPYLAALKGSHRSTWKQQMQDHGYAHKRGPGGERIVLQVRGPRALGAGVPSVGAEHGGGDQIGVGGGGGGYVNADMKVEDKACPCGAGTCLVLPSNTLKDPGRKFYKCPMRCHGVLYRLAIPLAAEVAWSNISISMVAKLFHIFPVHVLMAAIALASRGLRQQ
ncbi:unnamed protein product [Miscanthus lutarioriparius]|uniref:Uncharacterized protein n=1 Tax=Miscanthus lutarioriparius TaxID=422564 RepID=A0A811MIN8_9POAL|nr:unnamed protein product [Miscanthus lutarioriparius]